MKKEFLQNIVIATDGSKNSQKAISHGIEIAKLSGAIVHALYVVNTSSTISENWTAGKETIYNIMKGDGQKAVSKVKKIGIDSGVEVREVILEGYPSSQIIYFAENNNIDLIVMGTLGATGLERFLMGSVAEKVVRNSRVPVLVVKSSGSCCQE
ncbi:Universal stress protein [Methanosarcina barkeri 3]|uniref:Universal stress protein n=1 Tax=Methanosarcina barkeri 3 TaxID=1434107 RepID=A0A0E3SNG9_METBA|nr:universal stress protein [Methanosarcina barkeri]AKB82733.1 Universal stress protein [Methanosarcina barkeri 3]